MHPEQTKLAESPSAEQADSPPTSWSEIGPVGRKYVASILMAHADGLVAEFLIDQSYLEAFTEGMPGAMGEQVRGVLATGFAVRPAKAEVLKSAAHHLLLSELEEEAKPEESSDDRSRAERYRIALAKLLEDRVRLTPTEVIQRIESIVQAVG